MAVNVKALQIPGAFAFTPRVFADERGRFLETWRLAEYAAAGIDEPFRQDNLSYSKRNVVRGLHYQIGDSQGQMVTIVQGVVWDVLVDLRRGSPSFAKAFGMLLDADKPSQIYMPPGVAHGFCVMSEHAVLHYKCTRTYDPAIERGLVWNDPKLAIEWPVAAPLVSARDAAFPRLNVVDRNELPAFRAR